MMHPPRRPHILFPSPASIAATAIAVVSIIIALSLIGWILGIPTLKSFVPAFKPMRVTTAITLLFSTIATFCVMENDPVGWKRRLSFTCCTIIGAFGLLTVMGDFYEFTTGQPWLYTNNPVLNFLLNPATRIPVVTAALFFIYACVVVLMGSRDPRHADVGHTLLLPVSMVSYLILLGYLFGIEELYVWRGVAVAFNTSIAFLCLCIASFCIRPQTWLMSVFTSEGAGADMSRRLLPFMLILPLIIGWLRLHGERYGFFSSEAGIAIVAVTYTVCFLLILWMNARAVNRTDLLRRKAEAELTKARDDLEMRVRERTADLRTTLDTLEKERQRFNDVLEMLPAYVVLLTLDHRIPFANRCFRERFGVPDNKHCYEFLFDRSEPCVICETFKPFATRVPHHWEWTGPDGRNYDIYDFPFTDVDGAPLVLEMGIDITDRKTAEAALIEANEMKVLGLLTSGVAHEVRNPLNGILAIMGALSRELSDDNRFQPHMQHMRNQVTRLTVLMEDLLVLGRPLREENLDEISMVTLVEKTLATWLPTLQPSGPPVRFVAPENRDRFLVRADATSMMQVIINLLENAHHHSTAGMEIECTVGERLPGEVIFSVKDSGTGISPDILPKIFDPFFTTRKSGTGLGLSIVRRIVDNHRGNISAFNNSGGPGATFEVSLPRCITRENRTSPREP